MDKKEHHVHHHLPKSLNLLVIVVAIGIGLVGLKFLTGASTVGLATDAFEIPGYYSDTPNYDIGEYPDTSGDYEIPRDYSDTPNYEGDNTVVEYQVNDNEGNLVWTGPDMQTYYEEHPENNPCGDDGENPYGWYISDDSSGNEDYGSICSTGTEEEEETCNNDGVCNTCGEVEYDPTTQKCCEFMLNKIVCDIAETCGFDSTRTHPRCVPQNDCNGVEYDLETEQCCEKSGQYLVCGKTDTCVLDSNYIIACQEYREPIPEKCGSPPNEGDPQGRYLCQPGQLCRCWERDSYVAGYTRVGNCDETYFEPDGGRDDAGNPTGQRYYKKCMKFNP